MKNVVDDPGDNAADGCVEDMAFSHVVEQGEAKRSDEGDGYLEEKFALLHLDHPAKTSQPKCAHESQHERGSEKEALDEAHDARYRCP